MLARRTLLALPLAAPALAQAPWPNRPVKVIVGFPPGGSLDVMTRLAAEQMTQRLGQNFIVEARTGASGNIGAEAVARAHPDGYTIGTISMHNVVINPILFRNLPYNAESDFAWISAMWDLPNVAAVSPKHCPARTMAEFITWAKQRPGGISYGSSGVGTTIHLSGAYLLGRNGIASTHVPFRGAAQTVPAILSGDIQIAVDNLASYTGTLADGSIRGLALTARQRWPALPDIPTMAEAGMDNFDVSPWHLWAGPAAMPREYIDKLSHEIRQAWTSPALQRRAIEIGTRLTGSTPEEAKARLKAETPAWAEMVRISGAQPE